MGGRAGDWSSSLLLIIDSDRPCPLVFYAPIRPFICTKMDLVPWILPRMRTAQKIV